MPSLIRATNLWGYDEQVRRKGGEPEPLLARHHLLPQSRRDDRGFLVFKHFCALLEDTAGVLGEPAFGMSLAAYQGMDILGPISVIARSSATVGKAIDSVARYLHLHCPALGMSIVRGSRSGRSMVRLMFRIDDEGAGYHVQAHELTLANAMQVLKLLCGGDFQPLSVHFRHPAAAGGEAYRAMFRCPACFDQAWTGFCLPEAVFALPLSSADHQTWQMAERYLASQQAPNARSVAEEVRSLINTLLPTGQCNADLIASQLSMHKRTLQRRLVLEDTSYQQLLDEERQNLARQYLLEPNLKLSQIAGLLGYSEQSAFNRACRDWFGVTPRSYRRQLLGG
ncbi:AraC family transcriptional regulator [Alcanivorax marinus]|uniref:AraC family transcriptional regulator n=1 Tax=Alloalcanivorax marinus TaxID=1177169 RepID=A0A9Q3UNN9_9GAMM|nr:AraC family transcriptional regulator [Alloalcanivorax marinus]MCC4308722.1 AraC family transcriptional regulator [Alloalcanivorax marinus]